LGALPECGYFNLPKATGLTAVAAWEDLGEALQADAERCANGVAAAISAGNFWPPAELTGREEEYDGFAELFHRGAAASLVLGRLVGRAAEGGAA
jgi:ATP-dependent helicase/nuclease subunit B